MQPVRPSEPPTAVSLYDAKTNLSRLVDEAAAGARFVLTKNGRPFALLGPLPDSRPARVLGTWEGVGHIADDFDAPLASERG
jgi:prevent-host-death family protein